MDPRRVFAFALGTQGLLILTAWLASRTLDTPPRWGDPGIGVVNGLAAAIMFAAINYLLLRHGPSNWVVNGVRAVYDEVLVPLFGRLDVVRIVVLGIAAGIGEEWLFRGVLQPTLGLIPASALFGLAHVGGLRMLPFGVWASVMGFAMGGLAIITGGLMAPIVAHAVYDVLALEYIRRGAREE